MYQQGKKYFSAQLRLSRPGTDRSPAEQILEAERFNHPRQTRMELSRRLTERNCGEMVSSSSTSTGIPIAVISQSSCRAIRKLLLIMNDPSRSE